MNNASAFLEGVVADYIIANGGFISLHTGVPTPVNEVTGGSYARTAATFTKSGSAPTALTNDAIVEFPVATAVWGSISHVAIMSANTLGNMLVWMPVTETKMVGVGDIARFLVGEIDVTVD